MSNSGTGGSEPFCTSPGTWPLAGARNLVDSAYHGYYVLERQRFQDELVTELVESNGQPRKAPMILHLVRADQSCRNVRFLTCWQLKILELALASSRTRFTAGAMGVGKTFCLHWLRDKDVLPVSDFVRINPDKIAKQLPEWVGAWVVVSGWRHYSHIVTYLYGINAASKSADERRRRSFYL